MEYKAIHRYARISARKARPVIDMVRGLPVNQAIEVLRTTHRRASVMIRKVINSAISNAEQHAAMNAGDLYVKTALVNDGPLLQGRLRWKAGPMGRMRPIRKRTSHIHIVLDLLESKAPERARRPRRPAAATQTRKGKQKA